MANGNIVAKTVQFKRTKTKVFALTLRKLHDRSPRLNGKMKLIQKVTGKRCYTI